MEQFNNQRETLGLVIDYNPDGILSENTLRRLSNSLRRIVPKDKVKNNDFDLRYLQTLHEELLRTADSTRLSPAHGSASLNALCGFIEQCSSSSVPELCDISFTPKAWIQAFDIFLARSDRHKAKPVRRLLLALADSLMKQPHEHRQSFLKRHAVSQAVEAICKQQGIANIKSAIQGLEHFIYRGLVTANEIVYFMTVQSDNTRAIEALNSISLATEKAKILAFSDTQWIESVEMFTSSVLGWVQYPDCAPAAGRFFATFFTSLHARTDDTAKFMIKEHELPLWISPFKIALERRPELLEAFQQHILPGLLHLSSTDYSIFLSTLPLDKIARGDVGSSTNADIHLCILVAKVAVDSKMNKGILSVKGFCNTDEDIRAEPHLHIFNECDNSSVVRGEDGHLVNPIDLGIQLLENANPSVRMAALSLLVSSPSLFQLPSRQVTYHLQRCLPYFHVETNAKPRNEFIALMKKLWMRLRGATVLLLKARESPEYSGMDSISDSSADSGRAGRKYRSSVDDHVREYIDLRRWYLMFLTHQLRPTASYQSHITALRILHALIEVEVAGGATTSKIDPQYRKALIEHVPGDLVIRPALDLLLDPFDDVRHWSTMLCEACFQHNLVLTSASTTCKVKDHAQCVREDQQYYAANSMLHTALLRAESKAEITGRADHADGVGRLYNLLYGSNRMPGGPVPCYHSNSLIVDHLISKLDDEVRMAKGDLSRAVSNASLHGHLIALRHITSRPDYFMSLVASTKTNLEIWREHTNRIHSICSGVWDAVREKLCFDAPEGHEPDSEEADGNDLGTRDALSFCWRALKESSSLLHAIVTNTGYGPVSSSSNGLKYEDYHQISSLSFTQLAELRHRGAFSTVSHTFAACCTACASSSDPRVVDLMKLYYYDALACMQRNASALTRRSAGLPAMLTGILATCLDSKFFHESLLDLQAIADTPIDGLGIEDARLPQVHALNCLKDIFTDARFGPSTEAHIADTLEIAASCLKSHIWSIRNCGLMLYKALLRRLNGGTDTASNKVPSSHRRSSTLMYQRYPNLPGLVLILLRNGLSLAINSADVENFTVDPSKYVHEVFSALEIVERFGLPHQFRDEFLAAIWYHVESPDWLVREKAAKALSYALDAKDLIIEAERLLSTDLLSQNALHGRLLTLQLLLARPDVPVLAYEAMVPWIQARWKKISRKSGYCPITAAIYFEILADLCILLLQHKSLKAQSVFDHTQLSYQMHSMQVDGLGRNPHLSLQHRALKRCASLKRCMENLPTSANELSPQDVNAMIILDEIRQNKSDESCLAVLLLVPPHDLRLGLGVNQYADAFMTESPRNAQDADFALAIRGYDLGVSYTEAEDGSWQEQLSVWVSMLVMAGSETSELGTRAAAAHSLRGFFDGMRYANVRPEPAPLLLRVYLALYDTLVDDDEDVRDHGAKTVSSLPSAIATDPITGILPRRSLSPPAAESTLQRFLQEGYHDSRAMFVESTRRLVGLNPLHHPKSYASHPPSKDDVNEVISELHPVADLSLEARTTQLGVFVVEKQNLYLDTVNEATIWALLLAGMDAAACDPSLVAALESWTIDGLLHFLQTAEDSNDSDALSPIAKSEVYTLYMRVILAAKVLMKQSLKPRSHDRAIEHSCKSLLEKLHNLGAGHPLQDLLLDACSSSWTK